MKIIERTFNAITGETKDVEREETSAEIKSRENAIAAAQIRADEAAQKDSLRQAVLTKLGLTAEDATALFG